MKPAFRMLLPQDWLWVRKRILVLLTEDVKGVVAVDLKDQLLGAIILDNWTQNSVQCHIAIDSPMLLKHGFLQECMDYVFNTCKRKIAYGVVPSDNEKALKLNRHMGFVEVARLKDSVSDGVDSVILEMTRQTSNYIPEKKNVRR